MKNDIVQVCLIAPLPPPLGGISHWASLITATAKNQEEIVISVVDISPRWRAVDDLGVLKRCFGGGLQLLRDYFQLLRQLRNTTHVIHLTSIGQIGIIRDILFQWTARWYRIPVVYHLHFGRLPQIIAADTKEWRLLKRAICRSHTVAVLDHASEAALRKALPTVQVVLLPNCLNQDELPTVENNVVDKQTILFIGWLLPSKGVEELMQCWSEVRHHGWELQLIGPGSEAYYQQLLEKYQVENVEFFGEKNHDEAMTMLANAGIFVLPSHTEGFPYVILESMALGKAIIATRVGAIPEMLTDECGLLVEPTDVTGLKLALQQLISDAELRQKLGDKARLRAKSTYSLPVIYQQLLAIWRDAASSRTEE